MTEQELQRMEVLEKFKKKQMIKLQGNNQDQPADEDIPELYQRSGFSKSDLDQLLASSERQK